MHSPEVSPTLMTTQAVKKPNTTVVLVHGTFATEAQWTQPESIVSQGINAEFDGCVDVRRFQWSGRNSHRARIEAGKELAEYLSTLQISNPESTIKIVAHSHGGNVAMLALKEPAVAASVDQIACLATPFIHCEPRKLRSAINFLGIVLSFTLAFLCFLAVGNMKYSGGEIGVGVYVILALSWFPYYLAKTHLTFLERRQAEILNDLGLPRLDIALLVARVQWDEAGLLLKAQHLVSEFPHLMWKSRFVKWLFVVSTTGLYLYDQRAALSGSFLVEITYGSAVLLAITAYIAWVILSQLLMALIPRITRSTPAGFGWEGVLTPWIMHVFAEEVPPHSATLKSLSCRPPQRGLRHSWVYQDPQCVDELVRWLAAGK